MENPSGMPAAGIEQRVQLAAGAAIALSPYKGARATAVTELLNTVDLVGADALR